MAEITPVTREEYYLAKAGGQDVPVPSAVTREEYYLEKLSNDSVVVPSPVTRKEKFLYFACGGDIELPSEDRMTRLERLIAKAGGMDVSTPTAVTRLEKFWANVEGGGWTVTTLTGTLPMTFRSNGTALINYKIFGTAEGAGVQTENLLNIAGYNRTHYDVRWYEDNGQLKASGTYSDSDAHTWPRFYVELSAGTYTLSGSPDWEQTGVRLSVGTCTDNQGSDFSSLGYDEGSGYTFTLQTDSWVGVRVYTASRLYQQTVDLTLPIMLCKTAIAPSFEPYGYKLRLTTTSGTESKTADIYIGDTKLAAEDYVDYENGKIIRNGTPQDPPLPFPELETFEGTNTLDSTETLGEATITGMIKEAE